MDNGIVLLVGVGFIKDANGLNPYCSGQWYRTGLTPDNRIPNGGLNPYCSGQWYRTPVLFCNV